MAKQMDQRLFYLLNIARHKVYKYADQQSEDALGVSVTQLGALMLIDQDDGCLLKDVAKRLHLNNSALTGLATRMVQNGLVEQLNAVLKEGFSEDEVQVILRFLNRLVTAF